jgi:hypothetical protein
MSPASAYAHPPSASGVLPSALMRLSSAAALSRTKTQAVNQIGKVASYGRVRKRMRKSPWGRPNNLGSGTHILTEPMSDSFTLLFRGRNRGRNRMLAVDAEKSDHRLPPVPSLLHLHS